MFLQWYFILPSYRGPTRHNESWGTIESIPIMGSKKITKSTIVLSSLTLTSFYCQPCIQHTFNWAFRWVDKYPHVMYVPSPPFDTILTLEVLHLELNGCLIHYVEDHELNQYWAFFRCKKNWCLITYSTCWIMVLVCFLNMEITIFI